MQTRPKVDDPATEPSSHSPADVSEESSKSCDGALTQAFKFLGKRWNGVILGTLTNGESGFAELRRNVIGISDSVLSERLGELQEAGLIVRAVKSGPPVSVSYRLSDSGNALVPALHALSVWAAENIADGGEYPLETATRLHESC
jgi:DNA-binding HxlR family transcriptional regulator